MYKKYLFILTIIFPPTAFSAIQILGTRVILNAQEKEQSFVIKNTGESPSLLQLWLSEKDNDGMEISDNIPLVITPPVARVNVKRKKVFRIFPTGDALKALPQDRESIFWLNVLDVPAVGEEIEPQNKINIAFRTRIKVFYRPATMKGTLLDSAEKLLWTEKTSSKGRAYSVTNNSPFNITIANLDLMSGEKVAVSLPGKMVAPYSTEEFTFKNPPAGVVSMSYRYISDLGGYISQDYKK